MSVVETGKMSAVETCRTEVCCYDRAAVEIGQIFVVGAEHMLASKKGRTSAVETRRCQLLRQNRWLLLRMFPFEVQQRFVVDTGLPFAIARRDVFVVKTGKVSAVEAGQMSAVET